MAIENHEHGGTSVTGPHIEYFGLLQLKGALRLEAEGLRMSRGRSAKQIAAQRYAPGKRTMKAEKALACVEAEIADRFPDPQPFVDRADAEMRRLYGIGLADAGLTPEAMMEARQAVPRPEDWVRAYGEKHELEEIPQPEPKAKRTRKKA